MHIGFSCFRFWYLCVFFSFFVFLFLLLPFLVNKRCIYNVLSDVLGQEHLHAIIEQVEEMLRTTCHTVIKLDKSAREIHAYKPPYVIDLFETLYNFSTSFRLLLSNIWLWISKTLGILTFGPLGTGWCFVGIVTKTENDSHDVGEPSNCNFRYYHFF